MDHANALRDRATERLIAAVDKAKRTGNVPLPPSLVITGPGGEDPPLTKLIQGGRGGEVRLKLYLTMIMMATRQPYDLKNPLTPRAWAATLALDPGTGPRRISAALKWLDQNGFIERTRRSGAPAAITLRNPAAINGAFEPRPGRYIGIPATLWSNGWILELSAIALALLLVLLDHQYGNAKHSYVTKQKKASYGLSQDTWTRARAELETYDLIDVKREPLGGDHDYWRMRNAFRVNRARFSTTPRSGR